MKAQRTALLAVLFALAAPSVALAHKHAARLSVIRAQAAISRQLAPVTVGACHQNGPSKVRCQVTLDGGTIWEGAEATITAEATLSKTERVVVSMPDFA